MRRALIVGSSGQDGRILFDRLAGEATAVLGMARGSVRCTDDFETAPVDVGCRNEVTRIIERWLPDEVYYLAAVHQASQDAIAADDVALFENSLRVHVTGLIHFLDALKEHRSHASLFYAASSLVFGDVTTTPQTEETPFRPRCIYGITKTAGVHACRFYRETHGLHASAGLLFNHESPLRRPNFVSQKIVRAAAAIAKGHSEKLVIGDLQARIDWGYAPDFIDAMVRIVRQSEPGDFVVATGETHSVQDFVEIAFGSLGLDWRAHVIENRDLLTRPHTTRVGDAGLLRNRTGWRPSVTFRQMVEILLEAAQREHVG
jgi:GDPmannose 4,6-dehydratase